MLFKAYTRKALPCDENSKIETRSNKDRPSFFEWDGAGVQFHDGVFTRRKAESHETERE